MSRSKKSKIDVFTDIQLGNSPDEYRDTNDEFIITKTKRERIDELKPVRDLKETREERILNNIQRVKNEAPNCIGCKKRFCTNCEFSDSEGE